MLDCGRFKEVELHFRGRYATPQFCSGSEVIGKLGLAKHHNSRDAEKAPRAQIWKNQQTRDINGLLQIISIHAKESLTMVARNYRQKSGNGLNECEFLEGAANSFQDFHLHS